MKAKEFGQNIIALQEMGDMTWENDIRVLINGKEYGLENSLVQKMPTGHIEDWYYLLKTTPINTKDQSSNDTSAVQYVEGVKKANPQENPTWEMLETAFVTGMAEQLERIKRKAETAMVFIGQDNTLEIVKPVSWSQGKPGDLLEIVILGKNCNLNEI